MERNRHLEKIRSLERANSEIVEVLNKDSKFRQLKQVFADMSNIIVSKKQHTTEMSSAQQELVRIVMGESLKAEIDSQKNQIIRKNNMLI